MRYSNAKERIAIMQALTDENVGQVLEYSRNAVSGTEKNGKPVVRFDLRTWIKKRLEEEGITIYALARDLGMTRQNLNSFLSGRIPFPLDKIEQLLWILIPECHMTDD